MTSNAYASSGPQPYKFLVTALNGPIPATLQPYEVWPFFNASGEPYFGLDVSATGPWGAWTNAQLQGMTVAVVSQTGWIISTFAPVP